MHSRLALTKLKTILLIDILIIAIAAGGYVYLQTIPLSPIDPTDIQLTELDITPAQTAVGQVVAIRFNVTNLGDSKGTYEANLFVDNVSEQTQTILLSAGETKAVTFTLTPTIEGMHSIKIGSLDGSFSVISKFTLSDLVMNRTQAGKGEPIGISVKITNKQAQTEEYTLTLTINGEIRETKTGQIEANSTESVLFEVIEQNEGTYQVSIGSLSGVFQIFPEAPEARPAEFELNNLLIDPQITEANSPVQISVNITNVGEASGTYEIKFYIDDVIEETETVQLLGGESKTVRITATRATIGSYSVKVDGLSGSFTIQKESTILLNNMFVKPYEVWPNQDTTVTVRTSNPGSETSSLSLRLVLDNEVVETKTITLAAGANQDVTFQVSSEIEGSHSIAVNTLTYGGFKVVKEGYHTLSISTSPATGVEFKLNGVKHQTFYSELLPVGERYTIEMPLTDPQGRYTFQKWDSGSTEPTVTVLLTEQITVTASFTGGSSCPALYIYNGSEFVFVSDISNHGWLGYIKGKDSTRGEEIPFTFYKNNPWDYIPLDSTQLAEIDGKFNLSLIQKWNEIFYLDNAYMVVVDHPADVDVYSTMVEEYLDPDYMGLIYTISNTQIPISAVNEKGENVLNQISSLDDVFTPGIHGIQSPSWDNITWNQITLEFEDLSDAEQIKLLLRAVVDWGSADDYTTWLGYFYDPVVPDGTEVTPPPYMEVKDADGNWVPVDWSRQISLPSDSAPRTYVVDLTGLFLTDDYSLRISNFWNVTYDYIAIDTSPQQEIKIQTINATANLYQKFEAGSAAATGNFTKYGDVTELLLTADDMFVIGRQGDAVSIQFSTENLEALEEGMVRSYFFFESCWFKDENGNWGFGFDFTVDPLPFETMSGFPYPETETYHDDEAHQNYLKEWNTRIIEPIAVTTTTNQNGLFVFLSIYFIVAIAGIYAIFKSRKLSSLYFNKGKRKLNATNCRNN